MPDIDRFSVDPLEAIAHLRNKVDVPTEAWTDIWQGMHARAFVVAGAQSEALLADFHEAVNRNLTEGRTLAQFREDFDRIVADHGWSYNGSRGWRSAVIFNTNLRMAYAAGKWADIQRLKTARPYLRYIGILDNRIRPEHRAWHNIVLPVDHPWWQTHFPPNGWNCRCTVQSLAERDLKRYGLKLSKAAPPLEISDQRINTPNGPVMVEVPKGIDPGFGYNAGEAGFGRGAQALALERHGRFEALKAPGQPILDLEPLPIDQPEAGIGKTIDPGDEAGLRTALRNALGSDDVIFADPTGARIHVGQGIADHILEDKSRQDGRERYFPQLPGLIRDPAEIWIGFARSTITGRVLLRRRYVKLIRLRGNKSIGIIADADGGEWSGLTFFRGDKSGAKILRRGLRVFSRQN